MAGTALTSCACAGVLFLASVVLASFQWENKTLLSYGQRFSGWPLALHWECVSASGLHWDCVSVSGLHWECEREGFTLGVCEHEGFTLGVCEHEGYTGSV